MYSANELRVYDANTMDLVGINEAVPNMQVITHHDMAPTEPLIAASSQDG